MSELAVVSTLQTQPMVAVERPQLATVTVLQFGPALQVRGGISAVERLIVEQIPALQNPGTQLSIRHVPTMEDGSLLRKSIVFARSLMTLRRALAGNQPLIVHIHFASRGSTLRKLILADVAARAGAPVVLHAHGAAFDTFYARLPRFLQESVASVLQRAKLFIALSSQWRDFYIRECELAHSQVVVLPNPVRIPQSVPDRRDRGRVQFLFLGRLGKRKGTYDLIKAFAMLDPQLRARAQLVLAGDGDLAGAAKLAEPLRESVLILPWIDGATRDRLLAQSDVFVLPSYAEGVPMALLEAMANGLPAITTAVGGIPDVLNDGKEGLVVQPGDIEGLHAALTALITNERQRLQLGAQARRRAEQFDATTYATQLCALYRRIAPIGKLRTFS